MQQILGYVRVSTREQNLGRQLAAMRKMGIEPQNIYMDKISGKDFVRPQKPLPQAATSLLVIIPSFSTRCVRFLAATTCKELL